MRHVNALVAQASNRRHRKVGHLFPGRFEVVLVDRDAYLLEMCRCVELNPVRVRMVSRPRKWLWPSYRVHVSEADPSPWLDTDGLHGVFAARAAPNGHRRRAVGQVCGAGGPEPEGTLSIAQHGRARQLGRTAHPSR